MLVGRTVLPFVLPFPPPNHDPDAEALPPTCPNEEGARGKETEKQTHCLCFVFFLLKYPPILLVLVGDGDPDGLSSPPHLLSRGVIAEQGKASQLVLTGDAEICKAEKQDKKGFKRATIATSCPLGSISLLSEHTQGSAAGYTAPSTHRKKQMHTGDQKSAESPVWTTLYGPGCSWPSWRLPTSRCTVQAGGSRKSPTVQHGALGTSALTL